MAFSSRRRNYMLVRHRKDGLIEFFRKMLNHSFVLNLVEETAPQTWKHFEELVEEHIKGLNEKISRLQDQMMDVNAQLQEHERKLKTRIQPRSQSSSVSGKVKDIY